MIQVYKVITRTKNVHFTIFLSLPRIVFNSTFSSSFLVYGLLSLYCNFNIGLLLSFFCSSGSTMQVYISLMFLISISCMITWLESRFISCFALKRKRSLRLLIFNCYIIKLMVFEGFLFVFPCLEFFIHGMI